MSFKFHNVVIFAKLLSKQVNSIMFEFNSTAFQPDAIRSGDNILEPERGLRKSYLETLYLMHFD